MPNWYELIQNAEFRMQNNQLRAQNLFEARTIKRFAREEGYLVELNTSDGSIEIFNNELRKVAEARRVYV